MARRRTLATACEALGAASVKASQAISALERSWGVRLVSRTTHLVGLTLLGAEYAPFIRRIVQYADEISYRADGYSDKGVAFCSVNPWIGILKNRLGALPLDEPRFARATVYSNRELDVSIRINPDPLHYGLPFQVLRFRCLVSCRACSTALNGGAGLSAASGRILEGGLDTYKARS